jgi:hypothetical protein
VGNDIKTAAQAKVAGTKEGAAAVKAALEAAGPAVVIATLRPGHMTPSERADIDEGWARLAGVPDKYRKTYSTAYNRAHMAAAKKIAADFDKTEKKRADAVRRATRFPALRSDALVEPGAPATVACPTCHAPSGFHCINEAGRKTSPHGARQELADPGGTEAAARVLAALRARGGSAHVDELAADLGLEPAAVRRVLMDLEGVERLGGSRWRIVGVEDDYQAQTTTDAKGNQFALLVKNGDTLERVWSKRPGEEGKRWGWEEAAPLSEHGMQWACEVKAGEFKTGGSAVPGNWRPGGPMGRER